MTGVQTCALPISQCKKCGKQTTVPESSDSLELTRPVPIPRPNPLIIQDEERRQELSRESIARIPSVRFTKWILDVVWYIGIFFIVFCILGKVVGGVIDVGLFSDQTLELPIRVRFNEPPKLIPWEDVAGQTRADGMVLLGYNYSIYKMPGGNWPSSVVVDLFLSAMFVMGATYLLRRIFRAVMDGKPFSKQNSVDFRRVGYIVALWGPIYGTFNFIQGGYYNPWLGLANARVSVELHWYPKLIIVGMVIIVIAHLFELASRIQSENELTI